MFILSTKYNNLIEAHEYLKKNSNSNFKIVDDGLQELKLISKRNAGSLQLLNDKYKKLKAELSGLCEGTIWSFSTLQNKIENINDTISQLDAQRRDEVERLNKNLTEKITSETNTRENSFNHQQKQIQALDDKHSDLATLTLQVSRSVIGLQTVFATKNSFFSKRTEHYFKQSNDSIKKHAAPVGSLGNLNDFNTLD
ncbi:MAG: hypothetical protein M1114_02375 [Candidatus Dependentiae bacterium]|nr:hypothetical protein [Candidatus Dependentiae bacterium]